MISQRTRVSLSASRQRAYLVKSSSTMRICQYRTSAQHSEWTTRQCPSYFKLQRYRNICTRAKLLKTIRRRNQWDWSNSNASFFTPRHIRLASHYYGRHRGFGRWQKDGENAQPQEWNESDGYELSAREKSWKQQMERMRQRVNEDPYEAVFGRRFAPFWSPLLPRWMRSEMWPAEVKAAVETPNPQEAFVQDKSEAPKSYAYASSTSWDSQTNKTKKSEWNSISGETKHYEYDPISNRMVETPKQLIANATSSGQSHAVAASVKAAQTLTNNTMPGNSEKDGLDALTATDIRASMGRSRAPDNQSRTSSQTQLEKDLTDLKSQKEKLLRTDRRAFHLADLSRRVEVLQSKISVAEAKLNKPGSCAPLQPAVDRMQSKPVQKIVEHDSSTTANISVPKSWDEQVDMLQAERIKRTRGVTDETVLAQDTNKLSKANEMLQMEIDKQKDIMSSHEERYRTPVGVQSTANITNAPDALSSTDQVQHVEAKYKAKIASLKQELDLAYKQSSKHADEFRDQIRQSEARNTKLAENEEKYKSKLASLRQDLDTSFKQSSHHADEFRNQLSRASATGVDQNNAALRLAEANVRKYKAQIGALKEELSLAYEQSARHGEEFRRQIKSLEVKLARTTSPLDTVRNAVTTKPRSTPEQPVQKRGDSSLVREVRDIYENAYGVVGREKPSQIPTNQSTDLHAGGLEQSLNRYEAKQDYKFVADDLEQELSGKPVYQPRQGADLSKHDAVHDSAPASAFSSSESRNAYTYKSDDLEQQLSSAPAADVKEKNFAYDFKSDNLEAELKEHNDDLVKDNKTGVYHFRDDGLEAELKRCEVEKPVSQAYHFQEDNLENELKTKESTPEINGEHKSYQFKHDNLEAELAERPQQATTEPEGLDQKSYAFEKDNLEAELAAQAPDASTTRQNRASLRQRISEDFKDVARMLAEVKTGQVSPRRRNPIDGMTTPAVGNYASPTGFVNHDPVVPYDKSSPKVRREEAVFSGTKRVGHSRWHGRHEHGRRRRRGKRFLKTAAIVVAAAAGIIYYEGAKLETQQTALREQVQRETWQQIAREYERSGERGVVKAMNELNNKNGNGLFWK